MQSPTTEQTPKSSKKHKTKYTNRDEAVWRYKRDGDGELLLEQYKPFTQNFVNLFEYGNINLTSFSVRIFVSKFIGGTSKEKNKYAGSEKYGLRHNDKSTYAISMLRKIRNHISLEDLQNDINVTLLILAKRYTDVGKSFVSYLVKAFPHELYRQLKHHHLHVALGSMINYYDPNNEDEALVVSDLESEYQLKLDMDEDLILNHPEWLDGRTAEEPFKSMSKDERFVLAKYYLEKNRDRIIGRQVGRNQKSINRIRNKIKNKLLDQFEGGNTRWLGIRKI